MRRAVLNLALLPPVILLGYLLSIALTLLVGLFERPVPAGFDAMAWALNVVPSFTASCGVYWAFNRSARRTVGAGHFRRAAPLYLFSVALLVVTVWQRSSSNLLSAGLLLWPLPAALGAIVGDIAGGKVARESSPPGAV
jgi:hypothetical protein